MRHNIYLFRNKDENQYKIGITKKPVQERIAQLQTGNPNEIMFVESFETSHGYKMENALHNHFRMKRTSDSHEWFELSDEDVKMFYSTCERLESNLSFIREHNTYVSGEPF